MKLITMMVLLWLPLSAEVTTPNFVEVAKNGIPAVVFIQVKSEMKEKGIDESFFNDPFFRHFFGDPREQRREPEPRYQQGQGSGFIVTPDGVILTNSHLVQDANEIKVFLDDGRELKAKLIGNDPNTDVAVIKVDAKDLPYLELGDSDTLEIAQPVMAIGNPLGLRATVTTGVVSAKGRSNLDIARIEDFIQTDAAINRGNSGGPLMTLDGKVIGINAAIVTNMGTGGYMGIGFAIPSTMAKQIMDQLLENGSVTRGFIGVTLQQVDNDIAQAFGLNQAEGALISDVSKDSPAEKAGLKQGDIVIKNNGKPVTNIGTLRNTIALMKPGSQSKLEILRDGKTQMITITLGTFPDDKKTQVEDNKLGIEVQSLTPEIAKNLGYTNDTGVVVSKVDPSSPAAWAGIKKGTLIVQVDRLNVETPELFKKAIDNHDSSKPLLLLIKQGEMMHYVSIRVG